MRGHMNGTAPSCLVIGDEHSGLRVCECSCREREKPATVLLDEIRNEDLRNTGYILQYLLQNFQIHIKNRIFWWGQRIS